MKYRRGGHDENERYIVVSQSQTNVLACRVRNFLLMLDMSMTMILMKIDGMWLILGVSLGILNVNQLSFCYVTCGA